ncbi:MAG: alpha-galactosidase [Clostridia bacterium]|nr:alpha-galactosidase [Clostridia bacterium]MBQ8469805.1 alpha-galactosidase [Clostridia bacterium]MBR1704032.1 alpha-galactosidase [Clostridia bacterium]
MYDFTLNAQLTSGGLSYFSTEFENDYFTLDLKEEKTSVKAVLTAKKDLTLTDFELNGKRTFAADDLFFANGFQSWSTSEEHTKTDVAKGLPKLVTFNGFVKTQAGQMGDYAYTTYDKPGNFHSFTFTYFRKKGSHFIELWGSRVDRDGFTIFDVDMQEGRFTLRREVDGTALKAGDTYVIMDVLICEAEYETAFDTYFFDFLKVPKPRLRRLAGYTSWYNYFSKVTEDIVYRDLDALDLAGDETQIFQIDDGYQQHTGDWLLIDQKKFPHGMKACADAVHGKGYKAGIWLAPFCAAVTSKVAKEHPDWFIKDEKGKRVLAHFGWGGAYAFDIYNPGAREYIKHFFDVILNEWGYDLVKLDFLYSICERPRLGKNRGQLMADGIDLLREACGEKLILGCGVPLGSCFGIFDACRIGPDANKVYGGNPLNRFDVTREIPSSRYAMVNTIYRRCLDGRAFANDPDVFFLRDDNLDYSILQKLLLAKVNDICGSIIFMSDNVATYDQRALQYLKYFFEEKDYSVQLAEYESADVIRIEYTENGSAKTLRLNLKDGYSNVMENV